MAGNILLKQSIQNTEQGFNVSNLKPGAYNLTVLQNGKIINIKFIKQ